MYPDHTPDFKKNVSVIFASKNHFCRKFWNYYWKEICKFIFKKHQLIANVKEPSVKNIVFSDCNFFQIKRNIMVKPNWNSRCINESSTCIYFALQKIVNGRLFSQSIGRIRPKHTHTTTHMECIMTNWVDIYLILYNKQNKKMPYRRTNKNGFALMIYAE